MNSPDAQNISSENKAATARILGSVAYYVTEVSKGSQRGYRLKDEGHINRSGQ
ncbi:MULTISPECIES: hypothetical protein [Klebsiella]|uniref:Uncharacterized protein n=1 Tax=Klebsiella huaxiensis TaxID=2153354 RepID=A0ABT6E6B2_9ENTR|nr:MULTISPECIES: hypothetical protein [Klebsiella]MDG1640441.1 hypothetical protein [Klebsiella huaxiensis]